MKFAMIALSGFIGLGGCDAKSEAPTGPPPTSQASALRGNEMARVDLVWPRRAPDEVAQRIAAIAGVLEVKNAIAPVRLGEILRERLVARKTGKVALQIGEGTGSEVPYASYDPQTDDLRVSLQRRANLEQPDIGAQAARTRFLELFEQLGATGVLADQGYVPDTARMAETIEAHGNEAGVKARGALEYQFTSNGTWKGSPIQNSGLSVSIDRTGRPVSVRVGGVVVRASSSQAVTVAVEQDDARARFVAEHPHAEIRTAEVAYAVRSDDGVESATTEPRLVFHYFDVTGDGDAIVASRQRVAAYSLTDPAAPSEELGPRPATAPTDSER